MMETKWLIERGIFEDTEESLKKTLNRHNIKYREAKYQCFQSGSEYLSLFDHNDCVVFYGSLNFGVQIGRQAPWIPGIYCDLDKYKCTNYYPKLGGYLFNYVCCFLPYGMIEDTHCYDQHITFGHFFCRPDTGFKSFTGQVVNSGNIVDFKNSTDCHNLSDSDLLLISSPAGIKREWRLVVTDQVITGSQYKHNGQSSVSDELPNEVVQFANRVLEDTKFRPEPIWTMDICQSGDTLNVLEIGCFSCAGLYECNLDDIVLEVNNLAMQDWSEVHE